MRFFERSTRVIALLAFAWMASHLALKFGTGGLWKGLGAAHAVTGDPASDAAYDLTQLTAVNETLKKIRAKYVDPSRIKPQRMFMSALDNVQREVAQVIVLHDESSPNVRVRVEDEEKEFRVDNVQGPWDVSARLREVFGFLQANLKDTGVKLREVEYAACNGILRTLDPHSVFLTPEAFEEMSVSTSGHFGGLGIVISMRDQMLTVIRPMPGTPAGRAGLKRLDRIVKINNESTLNMPLDDAVQRLRGEPGSEVSVWIQREGQGGWDVPRPFKLTREVIRIESVEARELVPGIGYVRIQQFQKDTTDELQAALVGFRKAAPIQGLVLDLRGNPGGLLDQAVRVSDLFLTQGVIVATVGNSEGRDEQRAQRAGTEATYPIVVLTNGSSASASEIVAGALKNHERAVVVGQTTFGKGSVQMVYSGLAGDAALKLTIAQYLTPGDISIQGVGVTPDIELDPMTADMLEMDLFRSERNLTERDLSQSLTNQAARNTDRPWLSLRYNLPETERKQWREWGTDMPDEFFLDFPVRFARDLVAKLPAGKPRLQQLEAAKGFIEGEQARQVAAVARDLKLLGTDWSEPPKGYAVPGRPTDCAVKVSTDRPSDSVVAGESMTLSVTVTNNGSAPIYQLRAITQSDNGDYDERELVFGKVEPGQTASARVPLGFCRIEGRKPGSSKPVAADAPRTCSIPKDAVTRQDAVKIRFSAEGGAAPVDAELRATVTSLPKPAFSYTYQIVDNRAANGDGQVQKGEGLTVYFDVKNIGEGTSHETQALMTNLTGDGLLLKNGRFDLSNMAPGDSRRVEFTADVLPSLSQDQVKVKLSVVDVDLRVSSSEKVSVPVTAGGFAIKQEGGILKARVSAPVRGQPLAAAGVVGALVPGAQVTRLGSFGEFVKVSLGGERFGFVDGAAVEATSGAERILFEPTLTHSPPLIDVRPASLATSAETVKILGVARDGDQVLDTYMFAGSQKVFYRSNRNAADRKSMTFEQEVALHPGTNVIVVVSRENEEVGTSHTMIVRRDGPNGEILSTPKKFTFGEDWDFAQSE
jgi:carboxyl-terminal processing protease